ncbi:hypothetical protein EJ05DRAFT_74770 [Pseudovirgaria hyperparasitica]|uniref:Zn(2)-C6 fungal-type domain-containing protein n=1 Tax=Pseudovirgaria hyperparasitica TaxID=470096 RepID=A0A6A6W2E3_9PEZI|nr:uncharacterized protein EJ05DRAFT_74770 [Pseudovirgaria hyperparasitica]KAF2756725.1 hypothetical protein EJ05DRAFT_74770 [Pseudovirgaria hyperparasitica]
MMHKPIYPGVTKRKQACLGCRTRKKKCDGQRPSCTPCKRWNVVCDYNEFPTVRNGGPTRPDIALGMPGFTVFTDFSHNYHQHTGSTSSSLPGSQDSMSTESSTVSHTSPESLDYLSNSPADKEPMIPPLSLVLELLDIFVIKYTRFLPCFHLESLKADVKSGELQRFSSSLLFAILAIAAPQHSERKVKASQAIWASTASSLYDSTSHDAVPPLRVLQAAVCIVFLSISRTDYSKAWLTLGKAWRQACAMGFNRIDATSTGPLVLSPGPLNSREQEERRRTMWTLMLLDGDHSYPSGWPTAIDVRQVVVHKPISDVAFNLMSSESSLPRENGDMLQQVLKAYETLGKAVQHVYVLQRPDDLYDHFLKMKQLVRQSDLIKESLQLSLNERHQYLQLCYVVWASLINSATIILLNHLSEEDWEMMRDSSIPEKERLSSNTCFSKCVAAATDAAEMVNHIFETSSPDILLNPHIAAAIYICSRPLLITWHETQDSIYRRGISTFLHFCDCLAAEFPPLGKKFKAGIEFCLGEDEFGIQEMRKSGAKTNLAFCSVWFERSKLNSDSFVPGKIQMSKP